MRFSQLKKEVLDTDLYSRSGTEVGVSDGALKLVERDGDYFPELTNTNGVIPDVALLANPDRYVDYPELNKSVFGKLPKSFLVGEYKKIYIGYATDSTIRRNAASAGVTTAMQNYLIQSGKTDGAITLGMREDKPYLTKPQIARTREDILAHAQSKYTTAPVNQILSDIPDDINSLSYTGLPHEIVAIRKLQQLNHSSVSKINYVFGIFYGETLGFSSIRSFMRAHRIKNLDEIKSLKFREGEWPGYMKIELHDGRLVKVRKMHANYLIPSHITPFSLYQVDYMSELADVSVGDAWAPSYEERGEGWSIVVVRSNKGVALIEEMRKEGLLSLKESTVEELIDMHSHGLDLKKRGAFVRIARRRKKGLPVPEYGYEPVNIPPKRRRFEWLLSILFKIFQSPITIWILEHLPISFIGWFFIHARNIWKRRTKSTKAGGLETLQFKLTKTNEIVR